MVPQPIFLVGYRVSREAIDRYRTLRNLPEYNNRILVQDLQSKLNAPLRLFVWSLMLTTSQRQMRIIISAASPTAGRPYGPVGYPRIPCIP